MKIALTISDIDGASLPAILAALGVSGAAVTISHAGNAATDDEGDGNSAVSTSAVDSTGLPWDERIHSKNRTVTETGAWRKKKGVQDGIVTAVEAELRARGGAMPQHQPVVTQTAPIQMPQTMPAPTGYPTGQGYPQQPNNVVPGPTTMQPPPVPAFVPQQMPQTMQPAPAQPQHTLQPSVPQGTALDFNGFMQVLTAKMALPHPSGNGMLVDAAYLQGITQEIATAFNTPLDVITSIAPNPNMLGYAVQLMQRDGRW